MKRIHRNNYIDTSGLMISLIQVLSIVLMIFMIISMAGCGKYELIKQDIIQIAETKGLPILYDKDSGDILEFDEWLIQIQHDRYDQRTGIRKITFTLIAKYEGFFWDSSKGYKLYQKESGNYVSDYFIDYDEFLNNPDNYTWLVTW